MSNAVFNHDDALAGLRLVSATDSVDARPFPHKIVDGVFDDQLVRSLHQAVIEQLDWERTNDLDFEVKWRSVWRSEYCIPESAREVVRFLNSGNGLRELTRISGIPHLIGDPYFAGGGFHHVGAGGQLGVHVDGNWNDELAAHRRLNLILYLNSDWCADWGGALSLFADDARTEVQKIEPIGGRLVILETDDFTYHGYPQPIECPNDQARTSLILYYYTTAPRPLDRVREARPHSALWRDRNWLDRRGTQVRHPI